MREGQMIAYGQPRVIICATRSLYYANDRYW